jgi:hypothetical protein
MPAETFRFRRAFFRLVPSWLYNGEGGLVNYSLGVLKDMFMLRLDQGVRARFPTMAPPSALAPLGRDRGIVRGINEPAAAYAARLIRWLDDHSTRGNPYSLMRQLQAYLQAAVRIRTVDARGNWYTLEADGTQSAVLNAGNWEWDTADSTLWSRFWVIIYPTATGEPWSVALNIGDSELWITGNVGTPTQTVGTTATIEQVANVRAIIRSWKPAGTICEWVIVAFDSASFDPTTPEPDATWLNWGKLVDGAQRSSRLTTARYWKGTAAT